MQTQTRLTPHKDCRRNAFPLIEPQQVFICRRHRFAMPPARASYEALRAASAFTLVELLTVIAIIGILAAIIVPTVGKVRQSANAAACRSNLRQIAMAVILYANEQRNNTLPGPMYGKVFNGVNPANKKGRLPYEIAPYLKITLPANTYTVFPQLICPGLASACPDIARLPSESAILYALNTAKGDGKSPTDDPDYAGSIWGYPDYSDATGHPVSINRIPALSRVWMLTDTDEAHGYWTGAQLAPKPVHGNHRNRAFFDGHVSAAGLNDTGITWK
ncbi:MAG: prepilin-type N-terminal cleavage/methylation domain-containing protein [Opitutaceae bacterium]|jgi:prepilin-type N-terminal cleavage/methylation domain-containing protein/prepilin-type processing-associated H-X9-DG protein|nr:prepilin-type N-terminal cleavage/methylation domain-containing protein [Opitutaceae bacterium]